MKNEFFVNSSKYGYYVSVYCNSERICRIPLYKGSWGIEDFEGYRKETVLISMFCYELHERTPDDEPPATL